MAGRESKPPPIPGALAAKAPETLAERFWSLARGMEREGDSAEPVKVVEHVLRVLDALDAGKVGRDLTANTINFLAMLRQYEMKGDLMYASPEQARGEQVDERSLVFSVGVLLFEKLTGRHPFGAEGNPQRLARIRRGEIGSGVNYFPMVPAELRVVLVKAMGPFPEERWSNLQEMRQHLEMFVDRSRHPDDYSAPKSVIALPALPDEEQTKFVQRPRPSAQMPAEPEVDLPRMARATARQSALRLETQPAELPALPALPAVPAPALTMPAPGAAAFETQQLAPKRRIGGLVAGMLVGAAAASIGFWAAWPKAKKTAPVAAPVVAAAPAPVVTTMPAAEASPTPKPTPKPTPAPKPTPVAGSSPSPSPSPSTSTSTSTVEATVEAAGVFDVNVGGRNALAAARTCIAKDRRLQLGVSLLIDAKSGKCKKVYFGATKDLTPADRHCIQRALVGIDAGGPPAKGAVINTSLHLTPGGDQVKAKLETTP